MNFRSSLSLEEFDVHEKSRFYNNNRSYVSCVSLGLKSVEIFQIFMQDVKFFWREMTHIKQLLACA